MFFRSPYRSIVPGGRPLSKAPTDTYMDIAVHPFVEGPPLSTHCHCYRGGTHALLVLCFPSSPPPSGRIVGLLGEGHDDVLSLIVRKLGVLECHTVERSYRHIKYVFVFVLSGHVTGRRVFGYIFDWYRLLW